MHCLDWFHIYIYNDPCYKKRAQKLIAKDSSFPRRSLELSDLSYTSSVPIHAGKSFSGDLYPK